MARREMQRMHVALPVGISAKFVEELKMSLPTGDFKSEYLRKELLSKYLDDKVVSAEARAKAATKKWLAAERQNSKTNVRLMHASGTDFGWALWDDILSQARTYVRSVLCHHSAGALFAFGYFTNGASTNVRRSPTAALDKLSGSIHISSPALKSWLEASAWTLLEDREITLDEASVMFTVPKKSDIDRVACKEPSGNAYLQRCVGDYIRSRLRRQGIDLRDQTRNRELARRGSIDSSLATIDLSSASDTISRQLVTELLPFEWSSLLDDIRVHQTLIPAAIHPDGVETLHQLEMFSSMGNGFTFELETLIFWALARSVMKLSGLNGIISVYGDDIIVPSGIVPRLIRIFHFCGFRTNSKKTFFRGRFRESCGGHYYAGFDVSPFYIRREIATLTDLINLLNQLLYWDGRGWGFFTEPRLAAFHRRWATLVPKQLWGGIDPLDPMALVTGDGPRKRLTPMMRPCKSGYTEDARMIQWFLAKVRVDEASLSGLVVDPRVEVGLKTQSNRRLGARTSWNPYLLLQ